MSPLPARVTGGATVDGLISGRQSPSINRQVTQRRPTGNFWPRCLTGPWRNVGPRGGGLSNRGTGLQPSIVSVRRILRLPQVVEAYLQKRDCVRRIRTCLDANCLLPNQIIRVVGWRRTLSDANETVSVSAIYLSSPFLSTVFLTAFYPTHGSTYEDSCQYERAGVVGGVFPP